MQNDDEAEFREQVFKEIDGIKSAAIEDIKCLDSNVKALAQDINMMRNTEPIQYNTGNSRSNSGNRNRGPQRVTFNKGGQDESDLDRADDYESPTFDRNKLSSPKVGGANSIVFVSSQKNIDARSNRGDVSDRSKKSGLSASPIGRKQPRELIYSSPDMGKG